MPVVNIEKALLLFALFELILLLYKEKKNSLKQGKIIVPEINHKFMTKF